MTHHNKTIYITKEQDEYIKNILSNPSKNAPHAKLPSINTNTSNPDCIERHVAVFDDQIYMQMHIQLMAGYDDNLPYVEVLLYDGNTIVKTRRSESYTGPHVIEYNGELYNAEIITDKE